MGLSVTRSTGVSLLPVGDTSEDDTALVSGGASPVLKTEPPLAEAFTYPGVVSAYRHRPPYPDAVFDVLTGLITDTPRSVLDLGAGEGALARPLAALVDHVDAVDVSAAMISAGRLRPGGQAPNLRWIVGAAETAPLGGPYALVTAGASMHWMRWRETFERLDAVMAGGAFLAIAGHGHDDDAPWITELEAIIARHSRSPARDPSLRLIDALTEAGLFEAAGHVTTTPEPFRQRTVDYVEYLHSTSSLAREWMPAEESAAFDRAVAEAVAPYETDGWLDMAVVADVTWGRVVVAPRSPQP
jgi:SAM-dependent methyltransferase